MDFNVTEYEKFINMTSDCTLLLTFKKSPIFLVWCSIKGEYPHLFEKVIKILLLFQLQICVRPDFFIYFNSNICNRLNVEAGLRIQLSSIKPKIKEVCKNVK